MSDKALTRIEGKIDTLFKIQTDMRVSMARQRQAEANHQKNIERFWDNTWPDAIAKIDGNSCKIADIEVNVAKLKTILYIWGCILTVGVPALATLVTHYWQTHMK